MNTNPNNQKKIILSKAAVPTSVDKPSGHFKPSKIEKKQIVSNTQKRRGCSTCKRSSKGKK